jgi:hypothetical protein
VDKIAQIIDETSCYYRTEYQSCHGSCECELPVQNYDQCARDLFGNVYVCSQGHVEIAFHGDDYHTCPLCDAMKYKTAIVGDAISKYATQEEK